jgi:hypothetical protein
LEKTALMASWGAAMPTPPIALEIGPIPIKLSPFVANPIVDIKKVKNRIVVILIMFFIFFPPFNVFCLIFVSSPPYHNCERSA